MTAIDQAETQQQILSNIGNWLETSKKLDALLFLFSSNSAFIINLQPSILRELKNNETDFHAYPAINTVGELMIYMIPAEFDCSKIQWQDYVTSTYVENITLPRQTNSKVHSQSIIPDDQAIDRISLWQHKYQIWMYEAISNGKIPEAFIIPSTDIQPGVKNTAYFALKQLTELTTSSIDLIIDNPTNNTNTKRVNTETFYDTCRPVPPFKPTDTKELYILSQSKVQS